MKKNLPDRFDIFQTYVIVGPVTKEIQEMTNWQDHVNEPLLMHTNLYQRATTNYVNAPVTPMKPLTAREAFNALACSVRLPLPQKPPKADSKRK